VIERLSQDLRSAFPEMKGFSPRNLKDMRAIRAAPEHASAWPLPCQFAGWMGVGNGVSKGAVLASECQTSRWLHSSSSLQEFALIQGDLLGSQYLPSIA